MQEARAWVVAVFSFATIYMELGDILSLCASVLVESGFWFGSNIRLGTWCHVPACTCLVQPSITLVELF
jgi:hypothetical protein